MTNWNWTWEYKVDLTCDYDYNNHINKRQKSHHPSRWRKMHLTESNTHSKKLKSNKVGVEVNYFILIKATYEKPKDNVIFTVKNVMLSR